MNSKLNKYLLAKKNNYKIVNFKEYSSENDFLNAVAKFIEEGSDIIELRSPNANAKELLQVGKKLRVLTAQFDVLLIVFDRIDVAKLLEADGVCLAEKSMPVVDAVLLTEKSMLVGVEALTEELALKSQTEGADYLFVPKTFANVGIKQFLKK